LGSFREKELSIWPKANRLFDYKSTEILGPNHIKLEPNMDGEFYNVGSGLSDYDLHYFTRGVLIRIYDENNKHISSIKFLPDKPQEGYHPSKVFVIDDNILLQPIDNETIYPVPKPNPKEIPVLMKELTINNEWGIEILDVINSRVSYDKRRGKLEPTIIDVINNHFPLRFNYTSRLSKQDKIKEIKRITLWWNENKDYLFWDEQYNKYIVDEEAKISGIPTDEYRKTHPWPKEPNKPK
jgi:hypothetical protein